MKRSLIHQMKNEWRSNSLLVVELFIVSVILWFLVDYFYVKAVVMMQPKGFDISNTYRIHVDRLSKGDVGYDQSDSSSKIGQHIIELADRLKKDPDIEYVSLSQYAYPFSGGCMMSPVEYDTLRSQFTYVRRVIPGYNFFSVFRIRGIKGETSEQLDKLLNERHCIISDNLFHGAMNLKKSAKEKSRSTSNGEIKIGSNEQKERIDVKSTSLMERLLKIKGIDSFFVAASVPYPKRSNFEDAREFSTIYIPGKLSEDINEICVRVRPEKEVNFKAKFWRESSLKYRIGNLYISDINSIEKDRSEMNLDETKTFQMYTTGMVFLLINIFLGLLGTFWFRTQHRMSQIALMKAFGATKRNIMLRQISEGLYLLLVATVPALIVDLNIAYAELIQPLNGQYLYALRFIITTLLTLIIMELTILLGCWMPIKKAMKVESASVLHED